MSAASVATSSSLPILDWCRMPLEGRTLIEASAGTGKTWNIGLIYLRLLLESNFRAEQILVTTFTDAAAQELRERLRQRLIEAERLLQSTPGEPMADDGSLEGYLDRLCPDEATRHHALRKIQMARTDLDRAPVSTIHALCQRIQRDYPLESGAAFANDKLFDEQQLLRECVEDFWRQRYLAGAVDPREAELLLKAGPEGLLRDLAALSNSPDATIDAGGLADLEHRLVALRTDGNIAELQRLADDTTLYRSARSALRTRLGRITSALRDNDETQLEASLDDTFEPERLATQEAAGYAGILATHTLIQTLQALRPLLQLRTTFTRGAVLAAAAAFCREEMPRRARQRHLLTFSMLIDAVYQRLCGEHADTVLAERLYEAFPVALIDEFQDTDQRQFAIFDRIYRGRGTLVMIGDPKQAIYSFRGGDIAACLRAGEHADRHFSLGTNYRSSRALVDAFNAWYGHTEGGFAHPQIRYQAVAASGRTDGQPYTIDGAPVTQPLVIHAFRRTDDHAVNALGKLERMALDDCANRIAELLNDPLQQVGGQRITPGDIAVLLSTNSQIVALRALLIAQGVPCVGSGRGNIFAGEVARELALILHAVLHADDDQAVRGALSTRLLGATLDQFETWQSHPEGFERQLERFAAWRSLIRHRGVLSLIEALMAERATVLLALGEGERLLTDLRHLGELLAAEESARQGLDGLYAWFLEMRQGGDGDADAADERQLRIESDARRVQLLTIHASKGLEYPIVFLPLVWRISTRNGTHAPSVLRYHDASGQRRVDLGSADFIEHTGAHFREDLEERMRLLYVAMTRAVHAVHVYWVDRGERPAGDEHAWRAAAIDSLILQAQQRLALDEGEASLTALTAALDGAQLATAFTGATIRYQADTGMPAPRATQLPLPSVRSFQWLHSFSGLARYAAAAVVIDDGSAIDETVTVTGDDAATLVEASDDPRLLALYPWRGPRFGDAVHHVFELARPGAVWPDQRQLLDAQLVAQAIKPNGVTADDMLERIGRLIDRARQADLGDGLRLIDVRPEQRIVEFEFQFPVRQVSLARLRGRCIAHGEADVIPASLDASTLNGMLTGFADLIVEWDGRYHVLDYKTNWLGARLHDYRTGPLDAAMAEHHYPLQALIYTVALHRYLRQRMDGYTAEHHLGDSCYLFVRALGLEPALGVWRHRWPAALIEELDDAFAGKYEAAA